MGGNIWQTMKTLYLLRHAKSSWDDNRLSDFERPLNDRGRRTARLMGELIRERGLIPEVIVSSPAKRASETATLLAEAAKFDGEILSDERIYEASPQRLLEILSETDDRYSSAMFIGHNPGIEGFIRFLTGDIQPMPTAALAVIFLDTVRWSEISKGLGSLENVIRPREEFSDNTSTS